MPKPKNTRKSRFRAALALAHLQAQEWAKAQGVTPGHLSQVLDGKHESATLTQKIDAFIDQQLKNTVGSAA